MIARTKLGSLCCCNWLHLRYLCLYCYRFNKIYGIKKTAYGSKNAGEKRAVKGYGYACTNTTNQRFYIASILYAANVLV